jgi:DHA3 family multidrug efflux protein-like MFS transporter
MPRIFFAVLVNALTASLTNTFVWFAITFWVYLETKSVLATSFMAGIYTATVAVSGFYLGSLVDRFKKKKAMLLSSSITLLLYGLAFIIYISTPAQKFKDPSSFALWAFILLALLGAITGNIRNIALSTLVTFLIPENKRDKANGMVGTTNGISFLVASIFSGLVIGFLGILWMQVLAIILTILVILHLLTLKIRETQAAHAEEHRQKIDIRGTIRAVKAIPGLFGLIFFNTFNNFLGGVFMALMDAYGLSLVSVQVWGILWGVLSLGFIVGGIIVSSKGLGKQPLRTLFLSNIVMWVICVFFTVQSSIVLLGAGLFIFLCLIPVVEASEQTIIQNLIPPERQGRVFGFAQSIEQAASPVTAFVIGPIAQFIFIPFMTTGSGVDWIGSWWGTGTARGIALLFTVTGFVGLVVTLIAMRTNSYKQLAVNYIRKKELQTETAA